MTQPDVRLQAIFFDAVGTLLHPEPSAAEVYAQVGHAFGSTRSPAEIRTRFKASFRQQEEIDRANGNRTSEAREIARWRTIVGDVLSDVTDAEACFQHLYDHFARPASWRVEAEAGAVLATLDAAGYVLGMASNFDQRLHAVLAGFPELAPLRQVVVSSEVGHRKPSPLFFAELVRRTELEPAAILLVGDDPYNDVAGAEAAGLRAIRFAGALPDLLAFV